MLVVCTQCQGRNRVPDQAAGKKGKCPRCGAILDIPAADAAPTGSSVLAEGPPPAPPPATESATIAASPTPNSEQTQPDASSPSGESGFSFLAPPQGPGELGRLGPYRVLKVLGQGGMGVVFTAEDPHLRRRVALKVMLPDAAGRPGARERFLREARTAAAIEHDHIVAIYQVGEDRSVPYIAMPLLQGCTLEDWLRQQPATPLPVGLILKLGREIASGLAAAHAHGLIHRDIKPANIFLQALTRTTTDGKEPAPSVVLLPAESSALTRQCRVKVLDFGLARLTAGEQHLTQSGVIMGTPAYMAPEQARTGTPVDARADLFSLGVVLYRLCTGVLPFKGDDMMSTLLALAMDQPTAPRVLNPDLPPALSKLVMQLLEKEASQRPASAEAVLQALAAIDTEPAAGRVPDAEPLEEAFEAELLPPSPRRLPAPADEAFEEESRPRSRRTERRFDEDDELDLRDLKRPRRTGMLAQTSMIVGIASVSLGVFGSCCCNFMAPLAAVGGGAAIVLGVMGLKQGDRTQAQVGIGLGAAAVALALMAFALLIVGVTVNQINLGHLR